MLRVPGRRVDRLLHVHAAMHVAQKKLRGPLILLVAAGRAPGEIRLAVAQRQCGRERAARPTMSKCTVSPRVKPERSSLAWSIATTLGSTVSSCVQAAPRPTVGSPTPGAASR